MTRLIILTAAMLAVAACQPGDGYTNTASPSTSPITSSEGDGNGY
ncbi:MAG: hypothetical protein AAGA70_14415 [Pseudomonadota bacterium]